MRVLGDAESSPDARVVAACSIAFFEALDHAEIIHAPTRAIALKLSHMVAAQIYDAKGGA